MDTIRACGWGLRSVAPHSIPSRWRSLAYSNSPFTLGRPSTRRTDSPMPPWRRMLTLMTSCPDHAGLAEVHQLSIMDHGFSLDEEVLHRSRVAEDEGRDRIRFRAAVRESVDREEGEVGPLADLDGANVVSAQARRAAAGRDAQRLAGGHRARAFSSPGGEQRLAHLRQQIAAVVRGGAVDREADPHPRVDHLASGREARSQPHVRGRAPGGGGPGRGEAGEGGGGGAALFRVARWGGPPSGPRKPRSSSSSSGRRLKVVWQYASSPRVSAICVCRRTLRRRASAADSP